MLSLRTTLYQTTIPVSKRTMGLVEVENARQHHGPMDATEILSHFKRTRAFNGSSRPPVLDHLRTTLL